MFMCVLAQTGAMQCIPVNSIHLARAGRPFHSFRGFALALIPGLSLFVIMNEIRIRLHLNESINQR